jgi:asparagine synthase (glutamine-hydrolysing)
MCGIAGVISFNAQVPSNSELERQSTCFATRGPDNFGAQSIQNVSLCHRRLSIIDLDPRSHQPMSLDGVVITFNGEIYNYLELKKELANSGAEFQTNSDTEVILAAYKFWGIEKTLSRLRGMFAFAIYDERKQQVYLARDVHGQKPLYYSKNSEEFSFSSDIRFISQRENNLVIDKKSLDFYFQEISMPQPRTIWEGVHQLKPAHWLVINVKTGDSEQSRYHSFTFKEQEMSWSDAVNETEKRLTEGILKRTVADVPIACFLSGGVDSGLVVSMLAANSSEKVNTFSVGFKEDDFNELPHAKKLAQRYDTNHTELLIEPNIQDEISTILGDLGEPFGDSSLIPSFLVTRSMAEHYKVALSGDGGDELYGYPSYAEFYETEEFLMQKGSKFSKRLKIQASKLTSRIGAGENKGKHKIYLDNTPGGEIQNREMVYSSSDVERLFTWESNGYTKEYLNETWDNSDATSLSNKLISGSLETRLLNDYLVKVDRSSMMNSLEIRSPFLDADLGEFAFQIPNKLKFRNGNPKSILKELAKKYVDPDIESRKKIGFGIPINHWLKDELRPLLMDTLAESNLKKHGLFNQQFVDKTIKDHVSGSLDNRHKLWCLLSFQIWYDKYGS